MHHMLVLNGHDLPQYLHSWEAEHQMIEREAIIYKKSRLSNKERLRLIDLFSGAGGMSLGFQGVGYDVLGGVENDPVATQTYALNFHNDSEQTRLLHAKPRDITETEPHEFLKEL